jgi:DNA-binding SARP family transcriptional activator
VVLLKICLLGSFQAWLGGNPVTNFESNKIRALLSYLAVEKDRPHSRDTIAGLLWPDFPERSALGNLRWALSSLRASLEERPSTGDSDVHSHLLICRESLQFNNASDYWLDVAAFKEISNQEPSLAGKAHPAAIDNLVNAVALYRGNFLEGFALPDSAPFEEWILLKKEQLERLYLRNLCLLADYYESCGDYEKAQQYAWRQVELEPWQEEAHQQLMRLMVLSGRRSEAMNRYEICRNLLLDGLGVEPSKDTRLLYESIRDDLPINKIPAMAKGSVDIENIPRPVFVGREQEMFQLARALEHVLTGRGQVIFVTGEAGIGKTALIREFVRRSLERHKNILAILGSCNAQLEIGGPYLPFLEALHMLTGDIQPEWLAGAISKEHVRRLRAVIPDVLKDILDVGPDLIDNFVSASVFLAGTPTSQVSQRIPLDNQLDHTGKRRGWLQQIGLFEQYLHVLQCLARDHPIMLVIDDLQWVDAGSLSLLFYLGRRLAGCRILILGAFRQDELACGRHGKRHPLESVINEFQEEYGDIVLDLSRTTSRDFVDALVDIHPNRLGEDFRDTLFHHTGGNPLFTLELMHSLAERGELILTQAGDWVEGKQLDWKTLPPRVEAVIAERTRRLPPQQRELLLVASVQGETFIAEVLVAVMNANVGKIRETLSNVFSTQHRLVDVLNLQRIGSTSVTRYQFHHSVIQKYLYQSLDPFRRAQLHQKTGEALEAIYFTNKAGCSDLETDAANLAWHFEQAGLHEKAVDYLLRAGREAYRLSSNEQAIAFYKRGIGLVSRLPDSQDHFHRELSLQIALQAVHQSESGFMAPEVGQACARAVELAYRAGDPADICASLFSLLTYYLNQAEYRRALDLASQLNSLAAADQDCGQVTYARLARGLVGIFLGDFEAARQHLQYVITSPVIFRVDNLLSPLFQDIRLIARIFLGLPLWFLGYSDRAMQQGDEAIELADGLGHLQSRGLALCMAGGMIGLLRGDSYKTRGCAESLYRLARESNLQSMNGLAGIFLGRYLVEKGQFDEGFVTLTDGMVACQRQGVMSMSTMFLALLAEASNDASQGLRLLNEGLALAGASGERFYLAELYRLRGELLLASSGGEVEAETSFRRALHISRLQGALSLELRTALSLARLYKMQNQGEKAYRRLASVYDQFTEGFDTLDLRQAGELLQELSRFSSPV